MAGCSPEAMLELLLVIAKLLNLMFFSKIFLEIRMFHRYALRIQYHAAVGWQHTGPPQNNPSGHTPLQSAEPLQPAGCAREPIGMGWCSGAEGMLEDFT